MSKPVNPYTRLKTEFEEFCAAVKYARRRTMWLYPADKLKNASWNLAALAARVSAADELGHDVRLSVDEDGSLRVQYVERPKYPWWV